MASEEYSGGEAEKAGCSLVEQAANDDQAIRPEVGEWESIELAPHADACPQLCDEAEREPNHCTAPPLSGHRCHE